MILKDFEATSNTKPLMVKINVALGGQFCQKIGSERVNACDMVEIWRLKMF